MSHEAIEAFRRAADAIQRGDVDAVVATTHPEAIFEPLRAATEGAYIGIEGIRKFLADTAETFDLFQLDYTDVRDLGGDRVLAIGSIHVRGRGSGVETDIPTAAIAESRDGLMWRYKDYGEARLALEAAGLAE